MSTGQEKRIILIANDGSQHSENAIDYYLQNIHIDGNHIVIQQVVDLPELEPDMLRARDLGVSPHRLHDMWVQSKNDAVKLKAKVENHLTSRGITSNVRFRLDDGLKPGQVICQVAQEEGASMIVMGTRGMGKIRRSLVGSVSDFVIHHAHCPVVVCRHAELVLDK